MTRNTNISRIQRNQRTKKIAKIPISLSSSNFSKNEKNIFKEYNESPRLWQEIIYKCTCWFRWIYKMHYSLDKILLWFPNFNYEKINVRDKICSFNKAFGRILLKNTTIFITTFRARRTAPSITTTYPTCYITTKTNCNG